MAVGTPKEATIDSTGQTRLGVPKNDTVCSWLIHCESNSFSGSVTVKGAAADSARALVALAYKNMETGTNSTAAITGNALVLVDASGIDVTLDCTSYTSGELLVYARPMIG